MNLVSCHHQRNIREFLRVLEYGGMLLEARSGDQVNV